MQSEPIILIPSMQERSQPSFHVLEPMFDTFLEYLRANGVRVIEPSDVISLPDLHGVTMREVKVEVGTPLIQLEHLLERFLMHPHPSA